MRICPKCLSVYPTSRFQYCENDGTQTVDNCSDEGKILEKKLIKQIESEGNEE